MTGRFWRWKKKLCKICLTNWWKEERNCGMNISIDKSKVIRKSGRENPLQITVVNQTLENGEYDD